jgi:hypothetical protein
LSGRGEESDFVEWPGVEFTDYFIFYECCDGKKNADHRIRNDKVIVVRQIAEIRCDVRKSKVESNDNSKKTGGG